MENTFEKREADTLSQAGQNVISDKDAFHLKQYCAHLDKVAIEFSRRFGELQIIQDIAAFVSNPFLTIDIGEVAAKFQQAFPLPSGVDMEMVDLQNDIELKARSRDSDFWGLVSSPHLLCTKSAVKWHFHR